MSGILKPRDDVSGDRLRPQAMGRFGVSHGPDPGFRAFDSENPVPRQPVQDIEAAAPELDERAFDRQLIIECRRNEKTCAGVDHGKPGQPVSFLQQAAGNPGGRKKRSGTRVEPCEIARIEYDARGVTISPLNRNSSDVSKQAGLSAAQKEPQSPAVPATRFKRMRLAASGGFRFAFRLFAEAFC